MTFDLKDVARAMQAAGDPPNLKIAGWSVDTRTQNPGDVYFALRGPNFDGHDFAGAALDKGASAVVVEQTIGGKRGELLVADTLYALQQLGGWARERWGGKVIGVTGSAGKTTTKDAIARALKEAREGDIVILAGKGHENYQVLKDRTIAFDDREVAREVLRGYGYHKTTQT